jgi:hypothetical protein
MGTVIVSKSPTEVKPTSWQVPQFEADATARMAWIDEQIQEGESWLEDQRAFKELNKNLDIFNAIFSDKTKSTLLSNQLKYNVRKFVETISEVREIGSYGADAEQFKAYANMVNKVAKGVYLEAAFPRSVRKVLQYSAVMGRGYCWPKVEAGDYGFGERQIKFQALGPIDVVPVQIPPSTNDVQDAYVNTIYQYMPIAEAHGKFPLFQSSLVPVSGVDYRTRVSARRADTTEKMHFGGENLRNFGDLYCEIRYTFVRDIRINNTRFELPMGDPGTSWFYTVPFVGQDIFGGIQNGQKFMRPAAAEDCRVYPYLRLMISASGMRTPMYDGPAFDWHGKMPAVQYDVDDWAWEGMGRSLVGSVGSIEQTKRKLERKIDQVVTVTLNPPMGYDRGSTGGPKIENFDMFEQDVRMGVDGEPQKIMQSLLPESVQVKTEHFKFLEYLGQMEEKELGIQDLGNLANMKLNLSGDNLDKALEPVGPIAKGIAAGMEASNAKLAFMLKFMVIQWFDTKRIIEYVGPDNITQEVFDFDPDSVVPSHMPDEFISGEVPKEAKSNYDKIERARYFAKNLRLISVPSTLLKITQQQEQLKWLTLKKQGAPISWATTLTKLGIENYNDKLKGNTEYERWQNETVEELKFKAALAQAMQQMGLGGDQGGPGQGKGGGRPNSNSKPAKIAQKGAAGGDPRTTVKTS